MSSTSKQALRFAENLTLPSVQVVVMSANMGCSHCRGRVTQVVSRMNAGLQDYIVDFGKKEVTVRGAVAVDRKKKTKKKMKMMMKKNKKKKNRVTKRSHKINENKSPLHIGFFRFMCCSAF